MRHIRLALIALTVFFWMFFVGLIIKAHAQDWRWDDYFYKAEELLTMCMSPAGSTKYTLYMGYIAGMHDAIQGLAMMEFLRSGIDNTCLKQDLTVKKLGILVCARLHAERDESYNMPASLIVPPFMEQCS